MHPARALETAARRVVEFRLAGDAARVARFNLCVALFFLKARIVGCDTLILAEPNPYERLDILFVPLGFDALAHVSRKTCREVVAFLEGLEGHHRQPPRQGRGVIDDS